MTHFLAPMRTDLTAPRRGHARWFSHATRAVRAHGMLAACAAFALTGCAGNHPGPSDALGAYAAALRENRLTDAYRLLSAETRRTLDRVDARMPVTARMELANGEVITLVHENGLWRLDPSVLDFYGQHSPRQALRSFVRALERRRWDVLMRFVPRRLAQTLTADTLRQSWEGGPEADNVREMLQRLRENVDRPIEVIGMRATMTYGPAGQYVMQFVREDAVWRIEDPE